MTGLDYAIFRGLHQVSLKSAFLNEVMHVISGMDFLCCGAAVAVLWFFWFRKENDQNATKGKVIDVMVSSFIAMIVARILTRVLPFTLRPLLNPEINYLFPHPEAAGNMHLSNSMPSDHAVLYLALATGIFLISKKAGIIVLVYLFFTGLFPRVYLGLHFPADIFVGALIGIVVTLTYSNLPARNMLNNRILSFSDRSPGLFYSLFFLISAQMSIMFATSRQVLQFLSDLMKQFV